MRGRPLLGLGLAAFGLVCLGGGALVAWHLREQTRSFFTDADTIDRPAGETSPRDVLWRAPVGLPAGVDTPGEECAPSISADGHVLYFARRQSATGFDLFVTTRSAQGWREPQPVAALNSAGDEIDPQVSPDGQRLYFASDRPGGSGHFDLWVAALGEQGPGPPANLGEFINSAGNECGAALAPEGDVLYFASDRPRDAEPAGPQRAPAGRDFNLYSARLDVPAPAEPVANLNSPFDETTPAVSPAGDFVYFASDRPGGSGGFDLYRARRVRGALMPPESLGSPVNTPQQELDPEVGLEGFGLYFVSKAPGAAGDIRYTTSREVFRRTEAWRAALRWKAVWAALWPYALWVLGASLLLFLLGRYLKHLEHRKLSLLARCMMASLLGHLVLLVAFAYWVVNVPEEPGPLDESILISIDLPIPGDGLAAQLLGDGTGITVQPQAPQAAPAQVAPWSGGEEAADVALGAAPSTIEPAAAMVEAAAAPGRVELPDAAESAASQVEQVAAIAGAMPEVAPASSGEPSIVIRAPAGAELPRVDPGGVSGGDASMAPSPGAAQLASSSVVPASLPGAAAPPSLQVPDRVALGAPPRSAPQAMMQLPEGDGASHAAGEAVVVLPAAPPAGRGAGALATAGSASTGGAATEIGAPRADGTALAPGIVAPVVAGAPRGQVPDRVALGAPPRPAPQGVMRLPEGAGASHAAAGEAMSVLPSARPVERGTGAIATAGTPLTGGAATEIAAPRAEGSALAPGIVAPMTTGGSRGGAPAAPRAAGSAVPPISIPFPAMDVAPAQGGATAGGAASPGAPAPIEPPAGRSAGRAAYVGSGGGAGGAASPGIPGSSAIPGASPVGGAPLGESALPAAPVATSGRGAGPPIAMDLGRAANAGLPAALGLELRMPDIGPPPEIYANRAPEIRQEVLGETGGSPATEHAVELALDWLKRHQSEGGRWDGTRYDHGCGHCPGPQRVTCDTALTGLSIMCFVAAGHTHMKEGPYREAVQRGLDWLVGHQTSDGGLLAKESMYSHGIATIALAEAYGMTRDPLLERPVRSAVEFIVSARNLRTGGWRYKPGQSGDTSVMGWQVMAMKSASRAGIEVPQEAFDTAAQWLDLVARPQHSGLYTYQPYAQVTPAMTAEGMFVRQLLGAARDEPRMQGSASYLIDHLPSWAPDANTYYWYYATLALFQHQGDAWSTWNEAVKNVLLDRQETEGAIAGSWAPQGQWASVAGRVYQTAMAALILEVYYRYLPTYVQDPGTAPPRGAPSDQRVP